MAENAGLQQGIGQVGVFVSSERLVPPTAGLVVAAQVVIGRPHAVVKLDRERTPAGGLAGLDRELQHLDGFRGCPEFQQGFRQKQLRPCPELGGQLRQGQ